MVSRLGGATNECIDLAIAAGLWTRAYLGLSETLKGAPPATSRAP